MWFGHVARMKGTLASTILQCKVEGKRSRGRPARQWLDLDDVKEAWTGLSSNKMWSHMIVWPEESMSVVLPPKA